MSLEAGMAELTAELKINNQLMAENNKGRQEAMAAAAAIHASKKDVKLDIKASEPKSEADAGAAPDAAKPEAEKKTRQPRKPKELSPEDLYKAFESYLNTDDADERNKRKEFVIAILNELGADSVTEKPGKKGIAPEDRAKALTWLNVKIAGQVVNFGAEPAAGDSLL